MNKQCENFRQNNLQVIPSCSEENRLLPRLWSLQVEGFSGRGGPSKGISGQSCTLHSTLSRPGGEQGYHYYLGVLIRSIFFVS